MLKILIACILLVTVIEASCPVGSYEWQANCFFFQNQSTGFADAESNCVAAFGGHLTSVHDGFTNTLLAQKGQLYFHESTVTDFWIGLTNLVSPGNWTWMDGTNLDFTNWAPGELQNATANCAALSSGDGKWRVDDCFKSKPYGCRVDKNIFETTTSVTTQTKYPAFANCSFPFIYFEPTNSCYANGAWGPLNWTSAEQHCEMAGTHLASIHSYEESQFISALAYGERDFVWTGAFSNDGGRTWKWSDGTLWDYNPWYSGYPKKNFSACGACESGLIDFSCESTKVAICKLSLK